jgi:hypothetical protein
MIGFLRLIVLFSLLLAPLTASTEEEQTPEARTEEAFIPNFAVAGGYVQWDADADFSSGAGSLSQMESGVEVNAPVLTRKGFRLTSGASYRWNRLDFDGAAFPLGSASFDLHRVDLPFNAWVDLEDRWKLWVRLQPGWYSDFGTVGADDFILTSLALLSYRWSDSVKVAFGAFYSRDLGEERVLPALGFILEPGPDWSLALTFPRVELVHAPTPDWLLTSRVLLGGAGWNIADPAGGPGEVDLNYRSIRASVGVDRRLSGPWWAYVDAGMQFGQEIEIVGGGYNFSQELDSAAYLATGIRVRF